MWPAGNNNFVALYYPRKRSCVRVSVCPTLFREVASSRKTSYPPDEMHILLRRMANSASVGLTRWKQLREWEGGRGGEIEGKLKNDID